MHAEEGVEVFLFANDADVGRFLLGKAQYPESKTLLQVVRRESREALESPLSPTGEDVEQVDEEDRLLLQHLYHRSLFDLHDSHGTHGIQVGREIGVSAEKMFGGYDVRRLQLFRNLHFLLPGPDHCSYRENNTGSARPDIRLQSAGAE